jgi:spermidine synthase
VTVTRPWKTLATVQVDEGALELRQRGDNDFLITIAGRVLMNSVSRASEEEHARLGVAPIARRPAPRVLTAGLGMGFTLRAALDALPLAAVVEVVELNPVVVGWCKGPLADATQSAVDDPRVRLHVGDVAAVIARATPGSYDAILLDLYEGPNAQTQGREDPFWSAAALQRTRLALTSGGVFSVWAEDADVAFAKRFASAGFEVATHSIGRGGRRHVVYIGRRR